MKLPSGGGSYTLKKGTLTQTVAPPQTKPPGQPKTPPHEPKEEKDQ